MPLVPQSEYANSFVKKCLQEPTDYTHRIALADYLQDRNDARAPLLRLAYLTRQAKLTPVADVVEKKFDHWAPLRYSDVYPGNAIPGNFRVFKQRFWGDQRRPYRDSFLRVLAIEFVRDLSLDKTGRSRFHESVDALLTTLELYACRVCGPPQYAFARWTAALPILFRPNGLWTSSPQWHAVVRLCRNTRKGYGSAVGVATRCQAIAANIHSINDMVTRGSQFYLYKRTPVRQRQHAATVRQHELAEEFCRAYVGCGFDPDALIREENEIRDAPYHARQEAIKKAAEKAARKARRRAK